MSRTADVIDLKTYRERKAEKRRVAETSMMAPYALDFGQFPMPVFVPVVFFMVWPAWVFAPQTTSILTGGGSGAA